LQKLLNPFPQIYDKPFSADVGTLHHDGATIPRSTSGSRVVVASTVESAAFSVSFVDFRFAQLLFATRFRVEGKTRNVGLPTRRATTRYRRFSTLFARYSRFGRFSKRPQARNVERRRQKKFH
jgi:hypothetical protein